ncbi:hybrid sensor histidine kinase/response regulator, partial [Halochromatium sp.]
MLVESSPDLIYMLDPDGHFEFVGGNTETLLRYAAHELVGQHFSLLIPMDHVSQVRWHIGERRTGERATQAFEIRLRPKQGDVDPDIHDLPVFQLYASGVYAQADGQVGGQLNGQGGSANGETFLGTYGVARDITERKRVLWALEQSEGRLRELAEFLPEMLIETDLSGRLTFFNQKTVTATGYSAEQLANDFALFDLIAPNDQQAFTRAWHAALGGEEIGNQEFEVRGADGRSFPVMMRSTPLIERDALSGMRALLIDTTEIKQTREMLRGMAEKAQTASRAKSEFLANMSHEIRTPMNGITGVCDLLLETPLDAQQQDYVRIIESSSRSLLGIINDILDFSKIEAGKLDVERIPFDPRMVIEDVTDVFIDRLREKSIELVVDVTQAVPQQLLGDPLRLRQILTNLISNAVKVTNAGEIHLTADLRWANEGRYELLFQVRDTGIGIPAELQEGVFEAFRQADGSTTRQYGGTGLGLAICKRIIELMQGRIWVRSTGGQGTTFLFTAMFDGVPSEVRQPPQLPRSAQPVRVMIVEGNPYLLDVTERMLAGFGCEVEGLASGEAALARCQDQGTAPIDVALIDIDLPGIDGAKVAAALKGTGTSPAVVMLSPGGREARPRGAENARVDRWLSKPLKQSQLFDTMMELLGTVPAPSSAVQPVASLQGELTGVNVLLAEDNAINQRVAVEILKRAGIAVETAENGAIAVERAAAGGYDLILMDVQMPELDGLAATEAIRKQIGDRDTPIIAMTAHAMQGDRERCLEAGMDDYVSKPIDREALVATIKRHLRPRRAGAAGESSSAAADLASDNGVDVSDGIARVGGDLDLYCTILRMYCDDYRDFCAGLQQLVSLGEYDKARIKAHDLKGASGNVSAINVHQLALQLEEACRAGDAAGVSAINDRLALALNRVGTTLAELERAEAS